MWGPDPTRTVQKMFCIGTGGETPPLQNLIFIPSADDYRPRTCRPTATEAGSRGIYKGAEPPSYAFFSVHFFGARQKSEQYDQ